MDIATNRAMVPVTLPVTDHIMAPATGTVIPTPTHDIDTVTPGRIRATAIPTGSITMYTVITTPSTKTAMDGVSMAVGMTKVPGHVR